jgi:N-succinyldiaminopimelate aminotransferase
LKRKIDPFNEIFVSNGANGSLSSFLMGLVNPSDECIIFEPTFPVYLDHLKIAGGTLKTVPLYVNNKK